MGAAPPRSDPCRRTGVSPGRMHELYLWAAVRRKSSEDSSCADLDIGVLLVTPQEVIPGARRCHRRAAGLLRPRPPEAGWKETVTIAEI